MKTLAAAHLVIFFSFLFLFLTVLFKEKCEFKRSHSERVLWKASLLLVTHVTDCPFYFCMKKKPIFSRQSYINYISSLFSLIIKIIFSV